jgi:hypothetical protein
LIRWGRRRASWWIGLVLPGLLLRALIPIGFMPVFGAGFGVQLSMCDGYAPVAPTAMAMSADMPMNMPMAASALHHAGGGSAHSLCPYGASPAVALLPILNDVPTIVPPCAQPLVAVPQITHFEIAPRTQSPRGPPLNA